MKKEQWTTENGKWSIVEYVSSRLKISHRRGWLINNKSGNKYVWSLGEKGVVRFMREYVPPTNIPQYVTKEILNGRDEGIGTSNY